MFPLNVTFASFKCFLLVLLLRNLNFSSECYFLHHSNDSLVCYISITNQTFGLIPQISAFEVEHIMIFKQYALLYCMDLLVRIHITSLLAKTNATILYKHDTSYRLSATLKLCNSAIL